MGRPLIASEYPWWQKALVVLTLVFIVPIAIIVKLITMPFERPANLSADEVADYLRGFLEGTGDDFDWDDFTSVSIADPALESIRSRAAQLTMTDSDLAGLESLLAEAEALRAKHPS